MVLSLRGDGVFPPSLQYTRGGKRTRTAMRHTGWPPMADREEPSGPENPTPPPSHRKVRVVKRGPGEGKAFLTRQLFTVTYRLVRYLVDVTATARLAHSLAYPLLYSSNKRIHTWSHIECAPQSFYCSVHYPLLSPRSATNAWQQNANFGRKTANWTG